MIDGLPQDIERLIVGKLDTGATWTALADANTVPLDENAGVTWALTSEQRVLFRLTVSGAAASASPRFQVLAQSGGTEIGSYTPATNGIIRTQWHIGNAGQTPHFKFAATPTGGYHITVEAYLVVGFAFASPATT